MATNHTENYQLNLWEPEDAFLRTEFNENTEKIDAALKAEADARTALGKTVAAKADASTVAALTQTVNGKADASALTALTQTVNGKADAAAVNAALAKKADTTAVTALTQTVNAKADAATVNAALAKKADASAVTAQLATQLHFATGSYTGSGDCETTVNLGVPAKLLYIYQHGNYSHWGFLFRGDNVAYDGGQKMFVVWGENSVAFKPHPGSTYPDDLVMFNDEGRTYRWIALY